MILFWATDFGLKKGKFQVCFSGASRYEPYCLETERSISIVLLNVVHFVTNLSLIRRTTRHVLPAINLSFLKPLLATFNHF